jgi:hypothetical protein
MCSTIQEAWSAPDWSFRWPLRMDWIALSFLIGAGLGLLTVTLVTHLRQWTGDRNPLLAVGLGTGVGYLVCNFPPFFTASAEVQALTAGFLCLVGIGIAHLPETTSLAAVETT